MRMNFRLTPICFMVFVLGVTVSSTGLAQTRDILLPPGSDTVWHGVFVESRRAVKLSQIEGFEADAGKKVSSLLYYLGWYLGAWADVTRQLDVIDPVGMNIHVTWEPNLKGNKDPLAAILSGSEDAIIDDFAMQSKNWGKPFFLRFGHEMNGNWYGWGGANTGQNGQKYIDAWRYVWNRFQAVGNTNAVWVWCPNADSVPDEPWNAHDNYYPGDDYVDWVCVDFYGLMWGDQFPLNAIDKVYHHTAAKPMMIGETAAADCGNYAAGTTMTKDQWIDNLFNAMADRPAVRAFFWFNVNKEADWRISSCPNPAARDAYRAGVANPKYVTRP